MMAMTMIIGLLTSLLITGGVVYLIYSLIIGTKVNTMDNAKTKALDVFLYVGIGISLVTVVTNFLQILFTAIEKKFPDVTSYAYGGISGSDVRMAIATLLVMFPIYILLSWYVARDIQKFLYKQDIMVRKVLIYLTLFVTILTLIGTLVSIIYTYLGGELSARTGWKAFAVFITALSVFGYYFYSLRRNYAVATRTPLIVGVVVTVLIGGAIGWSISIVGTPQEMRARRFDSTRLTDISRIQQEIFNRVQMTDKLPATLADLENAFQGYAIPTDPRTKEMYTYKVVQQPVVRMNYTTNRKELTTSAIFELCATFETERVLDARGQSVVAMPMMGGKGMMTDAFYSASNYYYEGDVSPFWNHGVGDTCFKRVISSDMYYGR
jgi:hypothetical protein